MSNFFDNETVFCQVTSKTGYWRLYDFTPQKCKHKSFTRQILVDWNLRSFFSSEKDKFLVIDSYHICLNPVKNSSNSGIDSGVVSQSATNSETDDTSQDCFAVFSANKWTTRITLARIFASFRKSSTDHGACDGTAICLSTLGISDSWHSNPLKACGQGLGA